MLTRPDSVSAEGAGQQERPARGQADVWTVLHDKAAPPGDYCHAWLAMQCGLIPGATSGLLVLVGPSGAVNPAARWSNSAKPTDLTRLAARAMTDQRAVIAWGRNEGGAADTLALMVAQPLGAAGAMYGAAAVAVTTSAVDRADPEGVAQQLRGGAGWLEVLGVREQARAAGSQLTDVRQALHQAAAALDALAVVGEHARLAPTAMAIANELATRLRCSRVSVGLVRRRGVRLEAMSHAATFHRSSAVVDALEDAMEEALVQAVPVAYPPLEEHERNGRSDVICISHAALAKSAGHEASVLSVLLPGAAGKTAGVITLERHEGEPFDNRTLTLAMAITALAGPLIGHQLRAHRWVAGRAVDAVGHGIRLVIGPRRPALKLSVAIGTLALLALGLATGEHRVSARALVEGEEQRAAVAPFDGFIVRAPARAGDTVRAGDLLAALDDRELVLERVKAWAEREKLRQRHQEALARHDRAATAVLAAQIDQAQASLTLAEDKLARARIVAPVDGIVVSGDLSQMLGSPVERGRVLFEVAPLDNFRLAILVDEASVRWVEPGQAGALRLTSTPGEALPFTVVRRTPVANAEDGHNVFRIEAKLDGGSAGLRPGMEGIAKISVGERNLLWLWLHPVYDAARLALWKWWP